MKTQSAPVLQMKHITKTFGAVTANRDVDLSVYPGEIHALLGENGAGKSTLMNILTGIYRPDGGEIWFKGKQKDIHSPRDAVALGIGMMHQHFRLIPTLTVAENVCLYSGKKSFFLQHDKMEKEIRECSAQYNLQVAPEAYVWQLSVGEQQRVEIVKLLDQGAEVLILDEPSAVLTPQEAQSMFDTLRIMADSGKAVIVISHKMNEVMNNADRITVLKNGEVEDTMHVSEATVERLTKAIVGDRELPEQRPQAETETLVQTGKKESAQGGENRHACGESVFFMEEVSAKNDRGLPALKKISLSIRAGEIFGIAGVAGNGQRELSEVIAGLRPITSGSVLLNGKDLSKASVKQHIEEGIAFIPEDRLQTGLVPELNFMENIILKSYESDRYSRGGILQKNTMRADAEQYAGQFDIRHGGLDLPVGLMSGGNQQKLLFARHAPAIIVCDLWPTSGAMTKELLYEVAANSIVVTVSGGHLEGIGAANGRVPHGTGLECRLMGEVGKAVARMKLTRSEANEIVLALLEKYEPAFKMKDGNPGKCFDEAYDMETIEPLPEWQQMYDEVIEDLRSMGLKL